MALKFKRLESGRYYAKGVSHSYYVERDYVRPGWAVRIFKDLKIVTINNYGDNKTENVMVANAFEDLGDDYRSSEHGFRERITEAVQVAHKAIMKELMGEVDTEGANPVISNHTPAEEVSVNGESEETRKVMSALMDRTDLWTEAGERLPLDSLEEYKEAAVRWLGDNSELSSREIDGADYSVPLEYFRETTGWEPPNGVANGGDNPLKSEAPGNTPVNEPSGKGHIVATESKLFVPANRAAVHFTENGEKCATVKRAADRDFKGYPMVTLEEAQDIKACANCKTEVEAEIARLTEALEASQDAPEAAEEGTEAQEAEAAQEAAEGSQEEDQGEEEATEEDGPTPEETAAKEFGVKDPWLAWENWGQLAKANRPKGDDEESPAYLYWDDMTTRIGELLGAE